MALSRIKRTMKESCPNPLFPFVGTVYTTLHPNRDRSIMQSTPECCKATNLKTSTTLCYPTIKHGTRVASASRLKLQRYSAPGFAEPEKGDVIVDVGAFVGEFTIEAAEVGERIIAVEPDPRNIKCLQRNVEQFSNVTVVEAVVSDISGEKMLQLGTDPTENSLLSPDNESRSSEQRVAARTLEDIGSETGVETVDFLKVDAEGAEPEVIDSLGSLDVRKIAVDAGPERDGSSTAPTVQTQLREKGYTTYRNEDVIFAHVNDD